METGRGGEWTTLEALEAKPVRTLTLVLCQFESLLPSLEGPDTKIHSLAATLCTHRF